MAIKRKKTVKKAARVKTKMVPSKKKNPKGLSFDVISKRKPSKKVVKKVVKKSKAKAAAKKAKVYEGGTLEPFVIPLPRKPKRKIPKDVTKRIPKTVPKRKSAVERERRIQFAKENPLMPRSVKPPSLPTRLRGRPALDTSMLLAPLSGIVGGGVAKKAAKASQKLGKRAATGLSGKRSAARRKKPLNLRKRNTDYR